MHGLHIGGRGGEGEEQEGKEGINPKEREEREKGSYSLIGPIINRHKEQRDDRSIEYDLSFPLIVEEESKGNINNE